MLNRRQFVAGTGLGSLALASLVRAEEAGREPQPHFPPTAKSVIFLLMAGGPSQVDTFDPKPQLATYAGQAVPQSIAETIPPIRRAGLENLMPSPWSFQERGESGLPVSELFPQLARRVDDLCFIRSMSHRNPVHGPGECVTLTGTAQGDRPSIGAWSIYGLGRANANLPAFITMHLHSDGMQYPQAAGWGPGFLPSRFQGTVVDPRRGIRHVAMPEGVTAAGRRRQLELLRWFNERHLDEVSGAGELEARIRTYETAFRMQTAAPELFRLEAESAATQKLYGIGAKPTDLTGLGCLLARRMVERGVRFVQVRVGGWDAHSNIEGNHVRLARRADRPIAGLLGDLRRRGLLDSTLVVWGGEFGRTPTMEGRGQGRDHSPLGYTVWLAGGGVRGGHAVGATDELGYLAAERPVSPHDLHATILHALGLEAGRLSYQHHGRAEVPTVFGGAPVLEAFG